MRPVQASAFSTAQFFTSYSWGLVTGAPPVLCTALASFCGVDGVFGRLLSTITYPC